MCVANRHALLASLEHAPRTVLTHKVVGVSGVVRVRSFRSRPRIVELELGKTSCANSKPYSETVPHVADAQISAVERHFSNIVEEQEIERIVNRTRVLTLKRQRVRRAK